MIITIDRAGRVVLPKAVRDRFHLVPGTEIELSTDLASIKLSVRNSIPALALKEGILVHTAAEAPPLDLDIAAFIAQGRDARSQDIADR